MISEAIALLEDGGYSCVIVNNKRVEKSEQSGIRPFIDWLEKDRELLKGAVAADKVIGRAAAMLMVYGGIKEVYGRVISKSAIEVFKRFDIKFSYEKRVDYIINRTNTGPCPMEALCLQINDPTAAYTALKKAVR